MDELLEICEQADAGINELRSFCEDMKVQLRAILYGPAAEAASAPKTAAAKDSDMPCPSPQQMKKRAKRLTSLAEGDDSGEVRSSLRISSSKLFADAEPAADAEAVAETRKSLETPSAKTRGKAAKQSSAAADGAKTAQHEESEQSLMPPPTVPPPQGQLNTTTTAAAEQSFARPQRAAKLKSEKNLKEPKLNSKMRQPSLTDQVRVKLEHEQRASQAHTAAKESAAASTDDSLFIVPQKAPSVVSVSDADDLDSGNKENDLNQVNEDLSEKSRPVRVKIKKEKISMDSQGPTVAAAPPATNATVNESSVLTNSSTMSTTAQSKRTRKKKDVPLPMMLPAEIKQERLSGAEDAGEHVAQQEEGAPVASRTRQGSVENQNAVAAAAAAGDVAKVRSPSIYEDAIDKDSSEGNREKATTPVPRAMAAVNETVNLSGGMPPGGGDATFCTNPAQTTFQVGPGQTTFVMGNANATVSLGNKSGGAEQVDATFNVAATESRDEAEQQQSFATAKQSMETARNDDSLLTDDDSDGTVTPPVVSASKLLEKVVTKLPIPGSAKFYKMPTRTNELFNPLVQSPVKKKVEAFENAAAEQKKSSRSKTSKDGTAMSSMKTPQVGKLQGPALGRFLTPTQASNVTPNMMAAIATKKAPNSASKAMPFPKMNSASNLKSTTSSSASSAKTLTRSNSADEMRKGIAQLNEERKRLREQKQVLAAQQREAKEKERAERLAKLNKEREEKRLKKLQEAELKKRELEEIQRKLREEANKAAAAKNKAMDQESEMLKQIKPTSAKMKMPPPAPARLEYNFEMLHEDDSTDDEAKTSYKRPPPPLWSRSHVRGPAILMQQHWPTNFIDSFFSVQPSTPDLREIFPNIKESYLKRNSSAFWSTPPRYSELPKY